jgi:hypothetical protein
MDLRIGQVAEHDPSGLEEAVYGNLKLRFAFMVRGQGGET